MIDVIELKKLTQDEKIDIVSELWYSMEEEEWNEGDAELLEEMERRLADMRSGKDKSYTWEEAMEILTKERNSRRIINA